MPKILKLTRVGDPILREKCRTLSAKEILSPEIQELIADMRYTSEKEAYGVGIAAAQVGRAIALSMIAIKPTPTRPNLERFETILINPEIVEVYGEKEPMWEGCMSCGTGDDILYAQVPRYTSVKIKWTDEFAKQREEVLEGFAAHVAQHETDHTNGILFLDKVVDTSSYMMADEYRKRISGKEKGEEE
jgi:peptide deformylase